MKRPKVTVGAIIEKGGKVLLTKRNIKPYKGYWCLPGGHIEWTEKAKEAIKREVKEETGLDFQAKFLGYYDEIIPKTKVRWHALALVFTGKISGKIKRDKKEVKGIRWFSKKELSKSRLTGKLKLAFHHDQILKRYFKTKV